jgi:hypothetical protein
MGNGRQQPKTRTRRSLGMSRLVATRLPVPSGSTAKGTWEPARAVAQAITVPSPPVAMTRSAPCPTASCRVAAAGGVEDHGHGLGPLDLDRRGRDRSRTATRQTTRVLAVAHMALPLVQVVVNSPIPMFPSIVVGSTTVRHQPRHPSRRPTRRASQTPALAGDPSGSSPG